MLKLDILISSKMKKDISFSGVNLLLAIVLFSTIVGDMLPVTNNTPLIGQKYFITSAAKERKMGKHAARNRIMVAIP